MITGISSSGGYSTQPLVTKPRTSAQDQPQAPAAKIKPDVQPADLAAPDGDQASLTREYDLFDVATRQFERILPQLELATSPVE